MLERIGRYDTSRLTESFGLKTGVFLVEGVNRGALYDTNTGRVYSINRESINVVKGEDKDPQFRSLLTSMGLATLVSATTVPLMEKEIDKSRLDFAWLEIIDKCNENCLHCYGGFSPQRSTEAGKSLSHHEWKNIIRNLAQLECSRVQLIGGEPFLYRGGSTTEQVLDLAEFAREEGIGFIEIFTNGTLVSEKDVEVMKALGVHVAVSVYSSVPRIHDTVTQTPGSFVRTMRTISLLKEKDIPVRAAVIVMRQNQETVEETMEMVRSLGLDIRSPDIVRPSTTKRVVEIAPDINVLLKFGLITEPNFKTDWNSFWRNHYYHSCLAGKLAITADGNVIPCIFSRAELIGNVREKGIAEMINSSETLSKWKLTKDNVLVCKDCEYRYACFDCRPLADDCHLGHYSDAPSPRCTYNPYSGEWAKGIWRFNAHGEITYEEIGSEIQ